MEATVGSLRALCPWLWWVPTMHVRELPVLTAADRPLIDRFASAVGVDAGRVLAYLQLRAEDPGLDRRATARTVGFGTELSERPVRAALEMLTDAGLVERVTRPTSRPGRPPAVWFVTGERTETFVAACRHQGGRLSAHRNRIADREVSTVGDDQPVSPPDREMKTHEQDWGEPPGTVDLALNWQLNPLHLPLLAARDRFPEVRPGGELSLTPTEGSRQAIDALVRGECDVAVSGAATFLRERERGRPVVALAVVYQRSPVVLYTTRERFGDPFESVSQLRSRRLGTPPNSETRLLGRLMLEQAGLADAVEVVDVTGEEQTALRSGAVDAVTGAFQDPRRLREASDQTVDVVALAEQFPIYGPTVVTTMASLRRCRPTIETVLASLVAGWADAIVDPGAVAQAATERPTGPDSPERAAATFEHAADRFGRIEAARTQGWGVHDPDRWVGLRAALRQGGVMPP